VASKPAVYPRDVTQVFLRFRPFSRVKTFHTQYAAIRARKAAARGAPRGIAEGNGSSVVEIVHLTMFTASATAAAVQTVKFFEIPSFAIITKRFTYPLQHAPVRSSP
jgi:hypothetical protein